MARKSNRTPDFPVAGVAGDLSSDDAGDEEARPILPEELPLAGAAAPPPVECSPEPSAPPPNPATAAAAEPAELVLSIDVPLAAERLPSEFTIHLDTRLTLDQSTAARRLALALDRRGVKLASGQRVITPTQAVRYLLENLAP